jgi:hypothetical protein
LPLASGPAWQAFPGCRSVLDATVDARGDVEPRRIDLALHQQRLGPQQIIGRQRDDDGGNDADDDRRHAR